MHSGKSGSKLPHRGFVRKQWSSSSTESSRHNSTDGNWQGLSRTAPPQIPWHRSESDFRCGKLLPVWRGQSALSAMAEQQGGKLVSTCTLLSATLHWHMPKLHHKGQPKTAAMRARDTNRLNMTIP